MIPVIEIFGPVVQGEGLMVGRQTWFLRTGGCDYRCAWCDTMYAVDPKQVRKNATMMTPENLFAELRGQIPTDEEVWITLSGGNPAMHKEIGEVLKLSADIHNWKWAVETQGSLWPMWLRGMDVVTISPKPPSSDMVDKFDWHKFREQLGYLYGHHPAICIKVVVFDEADYVWATALHLFIRDANMTIPFYLQPGTDITMTQLGEIQHNILARTKWITDKLLADTRNGIKSIRVVPQLHTLTYGQIRGV